MKEEIIVLTLQQLGHINSHVTKLVYGNKLQREFADISELMAFIQKETGVILRLPEVTAAYNRAEEIKNASVKLGIDILIPSNPCFPLALADIAKPPILLYAKGNTALLNAMPAVAVIGAREASSEGMKFAHDIAEQLVQQAYAVVSGLAMGCDTAAHIGTLKAKGKTIAVLAHGLDTIFPKENTLLARDILAQGGCLLSEYPSGTRLEKSHFIERDRLQSGLSKGVIVVQSSVKSGTMHTANFAKQQFKPLACVCPKAIKTTSPFVDMTGNELLLAEGAQRIQSLEKVMDFIDFIQNNKLCPKALGLVQAQLPRKNKRHAPATKEDLKQTTLNFFGKSLPKKSKQTVDKTTEDAPVPAQNGEAVIHKGPQAF